MNYRLTAHGLEEVHYTTRFSGLRAALLPVAAVVALVAVYALVQYHDDNVALRAEVQAAKARGCPATMQGRPFIGSRYSEIDLSRPRYSTLACYYKAGVKS